MTPYQRMYLQRDWSYDIDTFTRWKTFLSGIKTPEVRFRVIGYMQKIQERWPQYIKASEVPQS